MKTKETKKAKDILDRAEAAWNEKLRHTPLKRGAGFDGEDVGLFQYGMLKASDSDDGIERLTLIAFMNCPQQVLVMIGKTLAEFVVLTPNSPSYYDAETTAFYHDEEAEVEYGRSLILQHLCSDHAKDLFDDCDEHDYEESDEGGESWN